MAYTKDVLGVERVTPFGNGVQADQFIGWKPDDACDETTMHQLGDLTVSGGLTPAAVFPTNRDLVSGASYLITVVDSTSAATISGTTAPPNLYVAPGPANMAVTDVSATLSMNWPFASERMLPIRLLPGQVKIGFRNPSATVPVRIYAVRVR